MVKLREEEQETKDDACNDSSTLNQKNDGKMIKVERDDTNKTSNMIKDINILKVREGGRRQELERLDREKEVESVMIVATPPS